MFSHRIIIVAALLFGAALAVAAETAKKSFNISAGSAEKTLRAFTEQSGLQIGFPSEIADGVRTNAVEGEFAPIAAAEGQSEGVKLCTLHSELTP